MVVLPSVTLNLLLSAVFEKQRRIYPLPKDLGQAWTVTDFSSWKVSSDDTGFLGADAGHNRAIWDQTVNWEFWKCKLESHGPCKGERGRRGEPRSLWTAVQRSVSRTARPFTITVGNHICNSSIMNRLSSHTVTTQWRKQQVQPSSTNWSYLNTLGCKLCQSCFLHGSVIPSMRAWAPGAGEGRQPWPGPAQKAPAAPYQHPEVVALQQTLGHQQRIATVLEK